MCGKRVQAYFDESFRSFVEAYVGLAPAGDGKPSAASASPRAGRMGRHSATPFAVWRIAREDDAQTYPAEAAN